MACLANPTAGSLPCATLITYRDDLRRASIGPIEDCIREGVKTGTAIGDDRPACPAQRRLRETLSDQVQLHSDQGEHNPGNEVPGAPEQRRPVDGSRQ